MGEQGTLTVESLPRKVTDVILKALLTSRVFLCPHHSVGTGNQPGDPKLFPQSTYSALAEKHSNPLMTGSPLFPVPYLD